MAGLVPAIHVLFAMREKKDVDARAFAAEGASAPQAGQSRA